MKIPRHIPLSRQAADILEEDILAEKWEAKLPGYRRLCDLYCVSPKIMTQALVILTNRNILLPVDGKRARRINQNTIKKQDLTSGRKTLIIVSEHSYLFESSTTRRILDGVRTILRKEEWEIHYESSSEIRTTPGSELQSMIQKHPRSRWLLLLPSDKTARWFITNKLRLICLGGNTNTEPIPYVSAMVTDILIPATQYLLSRGHHRITCLQMHATESLHKVYSDLFESHGIRYARNYHLPNVWDLQPDELLALFPNIFSITPPTAIILQTHAQFICFLSFCNQKGIHIPNDVSVILMEDIHDSSWITPRMTYFELPISQYVKHLTHYITNYPHNAVAKKIIQPRFHERDSVKTLD